MKPLEVLFLDELADIYDAENRLVKALPKMVEAADHDSLRQKFQAHLKETEQQATKLEEVFRSFGKTPRRKKCEAMVGLIKEAETITADNKDMSTLDAALISAAQKVEHYEIASYGCLREWATQLGNDSAAEILQGILEEEKTADRLLTEQARACSNESGQDEDEEFRPQSRSHGRNGGMKPQMAGALHDS